MLAQSTPPAGVAAGASSAATFSAVVPLSFEVELEQLSSETALIVAIANCFISTSLVGFVRERRLTTPR